MPHENHLGEQFKTPRVVESVATQGPVSVDIFRSNSDYFFIVRAEDKVALILVFALDLDQPPTVISLFLFHDSVLRDPPTVAGVSRIFTVAGRVYIYLLGCAAGSNGAATCGENGEKNMSENIGDMSDNELWQLTQSDDKQVRADALIELAWRMQSANGPREGMIEAATARALYAELDMPAGESRAGYFEARSLHQFDRCEEAIPILDRTIELYRMYAGEIELADAIAQRAECMGELDNVAECESGYRTAIALYEGNDAFTPAGIASLNLGESQGSDSRQSEALVSFTHALEVFQRGGDLTGSGRAHDRMAAALIDMGDLDEAIEHLREALRIFEYMQVEWRWNWAKYRLGWTLVSNGEPDEARPLLEDAASFYKARNEYARAADADTQLAHALSNTGSEEAARELYRSTRAVYAGLGKTHAAALADGNIAASLARSGEYDEAVTLYRKVIEFAREHDDGYLVRGVSTRLAAALLELETFDAAEEALRVLDDSPVENWGDALADLVSQLDMYRRVYAWLGHDEKEVEVANRILSFGVQSGFMSATANAYRTLGLREDLLGNHEQSTLLLAQAIALYLADGNDYSARELSKRLMPEPTPPVTDVLRAESENSAPTTGEIPLDLGGEWDDGQ